MHPGEYRSVPRKRLNLTSLAASLIVHAVVVSIVLLWLLPPARLPEVNEAVVEVQIVMLPAPASERPEASHSPSVRDVPVEPLTAGDAMTEVTPEPDLSVSADSYATQGAPERVKPQHMLSEAVLADPRSRDVRKTLSALTAAEQVEQLCNLEAMAQVGEWSRRLQPDRVVAYATAATKLTGTSFSAEGAALHSGTDWYGLQFTCDLAQDSQKVIAFEFVVGDVIPREDWSKYSLPDEVGSSD